MARSKHYLIFALLLILVAVFSISGQQVFAQSENEPRFFPETGHWVTNEFYLKYYEVSKPTTLYGAPITEAFVDSTGTKVQYFEKVRFELDPALPPGIQVKLSPIGNELYQEGQLLEVPSNSRACRSFVESDHSICYAFLDFFEAHGGVTQFGYPVSGFEVHDGWIVQYFQKARFEWHPENKPGEWVTVSNLGVRYFYHRGEDPKLLSPANETDALSSSKTIELRPRAFVSSAVLPSGNTQTIYVIVQNQGLRPVQNAEVEFTVLLPDGSSKEYRANNTNQAGVSILDFAVASGTTGIANIYVTVTHDGLIGKTRTSFQIWW